MAELRLSDDAKGKLIERLDTLKLEIANCAMYPLSGEERVRGHKRAKQEMTARNELRRQRDHARAESEALRKRSANLEATLDRIRKSIVASGELDYTLSPNVDGGVKRVCLKRDMQGLGCISEYGHEGPHMSIDGSRWG